MILDGTLSADASAEQATGIRKNVIRNDKKKLLENKKPFPPQRSKKG